MAQVGCNSKHKCAVSAQYFYIQIIYIFFKYFQMKMKRRSFVNGVISVNIIPIMMTIGSPASGVQIHATAAKVVVRAIAIKTIAPYRRHRPHPHRRVHVVNHVRCPAKRHARRQIAERRTMQQRHQMPPPRQCPRMRCHPRLWRVCWKPRLPFRKRWTGNVVMKTAMAMAIAIVMAVLRDHQRPLWRHQL